MAVEVPVVDQKEIALESTPTIFTPPLYLQRYDAVVKAIANHSTPIKSVADLGCAEGNLLRFVKTIKHVEKIIAVDRDRFVLEYANRRIEPVACDYVLGREFQLDILIYEGDICKPDPRLIGLDAITCVEVIEHMEESKVDELANCIFGIYKPKLVAITTPNFEFNVVFGNKELTFRHYDHKFEWTRSQFAEWCEKVVKSYPDFVYEITGVGLPTEDFPNVGFASQIAFFRLISTNGPRFETNVQENYKQLWKYKIEQKEQQVFEFVDW
ncbi:small RNA 2'-O-methyltransferase-like [Tetranychus urticae]|uniref:Small RNA 2'-O-methyltransferase n=1 Tax=Tetranychus urticae TaxID=32264 RepID=T1KRW7_TETUR|nr:small RNA 2'-O-methyltransferase-like [Tetranychus urticae]